MEGIGGGGTAMRDAERDDSTDAVLERRVRIDSKRVKSERGAKRDEPS